MAVEVINVVQNTPLEVGDGPKGHVDQAGVDSFAAAEAAFLKEEAATAEAEKPAAAAAEKAEENSSQKADKKEEKGDGAGDDTVSTDADKSGEQAGDKPAALSKGQQKKADRAAAAARRSAEAETQAAREEAAAAKRELAALKAGKQTETSSAPAEGEPDPEKYEYGTLDPKYQRDVRAYDREQIKKDLLADQQTKAAEAKASETVANFEARVDAFLEVHDDYYEKVEDGLRDGKWTLPKAIGDVIMDNAAAPQVLYYLAENPKIADALNAMPPSRQLVELGKLEAKLGSEAPATGKTAKTPAISKADPPGEAVRGSGGKFAANSATTDFAAFERTHSHLLNQ